ncbi:hypothetical protein C8R46DRAFT_580970 [Mycena filopes]|nr:hypothetical protein C8R46DRAFT_1361959 [Mycena filopes]KAJ7141557.1 hypothetical protein C8R46DRAFT_580970 [Mycena filopes]
MYAASIVSHTSLSRSSLYTTTSSSTNWGPGALSGKAIRAMGKAVLRGVDYLVISRRLSRMKAVMPCPDDDLEKRSDWRQMFFDALELSRPELYPEEFRMQALRILLGQIATRQTHYLRACIAEWDAEPEDRVALLSVIVGVTLFPKRHFIDDTLASSYTMALPSNCHSWTPCVSFLSGVARSNEGGFRAALDARFLEMTLWAAAAPRDPSTVDEELVHNCAAAFSLLSQPTSDALSLLWTDRIRRFSLEETVTSLPDAVDSIARHRRWWLVECRLLEMHAAAMLQLMHLPSDRTDSGVDVGRTSLSAAPVYFAKALNPRMPEFDVQLILSEGFMHSYLRCVGMGSDVLRQTVDHLSRLSYPKQVATFGHMVRHLIAQSVVEGSRRVAVPLFTPQLTHVAFNVIAFLVSLTKTEEVPSAKDALLDAALLSILPFLPLSWDPLSVHGDVYRRAYSPRKRIRASYGGNISKLLEEIRTSGLRTVVAESSWTRTWVHFLQPLFD